MDIKIVLFAFVILLGTFFGSGMDANRKQQKWYVIIMTAILILESGLRSVDVGNDTISYYYYFLSIKDMSWGEIFDSFGASYQGGEGKDPGFALFVKIIQIVSTDFNFFLIVSALIFFIPLGMILHKYSSRIIQLVFAFTLYVALFHIVALSGIRQQLATGFTFMAFLLLGDGKRLLSVLVIFLGAMLHISAALFILVPALSFVNRRLLKPIHLSSFLTIPFAIVYAGAIMNFLASFLANDYYGIYGQDESAGGAVTYIALMELLSLFCYFTIKNKAVVDNRLIGLLYIMLPLLTMTVPLISLNGAMIRVGQYFTLYMMLLAPIAIDSFTAKGNRQIYYYGMIAALMLLSLNSRSFHYSFFWQ